MPRAGSAGVGAPGQEPHNTASPGGRAKQASAPLWAAQEFCPFREAASQQSIMSEEMRTTYSLLSAPEGSAMAHSPHLTTWPQVRPPHKSPLPSWLHHPRA